MGSTKVSSSQSGESTSTQKATPTAEETALNKLNLERAQGAQSGLLQSDQSSLSLLNNLLQGKDLPGYLGGLPGGLSDSNITDISQKAVRDIQPQFQQNGLLDSGVNAQISGRTAGDIRRQSYEYNQNLLLNLLNLSTGAPAQIQAPIGQNNQILNQSLAGLRTISQSGTSSQTGSQRTNYDFFTSPFTNSLIGAGGNAAKAFATCWVASEIFGGMFELKTIATRFYINFLAPSWFKKLYIKFGERFAGFIKDKPVIKSILRPLFESFAVKGGFHGA